VLFNVLISIILGFIDGLLGLTDSGGLGPLRGLYTLAVLIPSLAVAVRRLHDTGKSGWFLLLALIPCVGGIILLIFMAQEGESGGNQYGSDPKEETI
jgi:uncharacterized membrane protein YhaH (DUF805 family)